MKARPLPGGESGVGPEEPLELFLKNINLTTTSFPPSFLNNKLFYNKHSKMRRKIIPYKPWLKEYARKLRNHITFTEILLWGFLKKKQMLGYDFDRQRPIDNFIVDFYCKDLFLAIEIDGESHYGNRDKDEKRDLRLNELGVTVLRFDDLEVRHNTEGVLKYIEKWIKEREKARV